MKEIILSLFLLVVSIIPKTYATEQCPEIIEFEDKTYFILHAEPLESYLCTLKNRPALEIEPNMGRSDLWRGYIATWVIKNEKLYLKDIQAFVDGKKISIYNLSTEFQNKDGAIFAHWFSGNFYIAEEKIKDIEWEAKFEAVVKNGIIEKITKVGFLNHFNDKYTLSPVDYRDVNWNIYGEYHDSLSCLGGIVLHLFPNNKFLYIEWCDICEDKMIAKGTYEFKNSKIFLSYDYVDEQYKQGGLNDSLNALYAQGGEDSDGLTAILVNEQDFEELKKDPDFGKYMFRLREYPDWQAIYNSFEKKK